MKPALIPEGLEALVRNNKVKLLAFQPGVVVCETYQTNK